jgi:hypothetical protein
MARTIAANYPTGLELTATSDSPVTVLAGVSIANSAGVALFVDPGAWSIDNSGLIQATDLTAGYGTALYLKPSTAPVVSQMVLTNQSAGQILGNEFGVFIKASSGTVDNRGSISGATLAGVILGGGGTIANDAGASIMGGAYGALIYGGLGSVTNQGTIAGTAADGVDLAAGGTVQNNAASASIAGSNNGVVIQGGAGTVINQGIVEGKAAYTGQTFVFGGVLLGEGGSLTNKAGGTIQGGFYGFWAGGTGAAVATVVNDGSIAATATAAGRGVALANGGSVTNNAGGTIAGGLYGVRVLNAAGTVVNAGSIQSTETLAGAGVALGLGGSVTNQAGGSIDSPWNGVSIGGAAGTVSNQGIIRSQSPVSDQAFVYGAVLLGDGGSVTNSAAAAILGTFYGVWSGTAGGAGTVVNAGSIGASATATGRGVVLRDGGQVTNNAGGAIAAGLYGVRVLGGEGTVTNAGSISSSQTLSGAGVDLAAGGSVTNAQGGLIASPWIGVQIGQKGTNTGGTFVNQGSVFAGDTNGDGAAVWVHGPGVVINDATGTIDGASFDGVPPGGFGIVTYYRTTVINRGAIDGTDAVFAANAGVGNLVEMAPGASFGGIVQGAKSAADAGLATLELLSGASVGTVSGVGPKYQNFGNVLIDSGARWTLGGTVASGTTVTLATGGNEALTLANPGSMSGTISGFETGDTLMLAGVSNVASATLAAQNVLTIVEAGVASPLLLDLDPSQTFAPQNFGQVLAGDGSAIPVSGLSCFAAGTLIRTEHGPMEIEALRVGMRVLTHRGDRVKIVWIGHRAIECGRHPDPATVFPVRIRAGAFGPGLPSRDLLLSPDHAVFADGMLIPIHCLIDDRTIVRQPVTEVTYYHIELPEHDVILAEDLPVESYLDTGDRPNFANGGGPVRMFPDFAARMWEMAGCAPLVMTGPALERIKRALARNEPVVSRSGTIAPVAPRPPWTRLTNRYTYY